MNIQNSKLKFFSIISGNDDEYQPIKNNFEKHLNIIGLENEHELIVTNTNSGSWEETDFELSSSTGEYAISVGGLDEGARYEFRAVVRHRGIAIYGESVIFTTG